MLTTRPFGVTKEGVAVTAFTITNDRGISVTVLDYGATLQSVVLPCKDGPVDVVLGYDTIGEYERNDGCLGASIGRYAGRIPDSMLQIGEEVFPVTDNDKGNHLHGGRIGFDKKVWKASAADNAVQFDLLSSDGEDGYPGTVRTTATYALKENVLTISYKGISDRTTAWNPTNHAYWNLNGHDAGDARKHRLEIPAAHYVPVGPDRIPTGGAAAVAGTEYDFRRLREIDGVFDNSFVLSGGPIRLCGERGIGMEIRTDCKAIQFYNAEFLSNRQGKSGAVYRPFGAVCLETEGRQARRGVSIAEENILRDDHTNFRETSFQFLNEEKSIWNPSK
ncbi:MAG: galactose mutarotase [Clostridia bacterium]|nr:galactose mutarotase [Clostridia bacterium]